MKMKLQVISAALSLLVLASCKDKSAFEYSQSIVRIEKSMEVQMIASENSIGDFFEREVYDSALVASQRMEALADSKLKEVEALKVPDAKEANSFRSAAIRYFSYIKSIYTAYKDYSLQASVEDRQAAGIRLLEVTNKKDEVIRDMQNAQLRYAKANGFRIEK